MRVRQALVSIGSNEEVSRSTLWLLQLLKLQTITMYKQRQQGKNGQHKVGWGGDYWSPSKVKRVKRRQWSTVPHAADWSEDSELTFGICNSLEALKAGSWWRLGLKGKLESLGKQRNVCWSGMWGWESFLFFFFSWLLLAETNSRISGGKF